VFSPISISDDVCHLVSKKHARRVGHGIAYPPRAPEFTSMCNGVRVAQYLVFVFFWYHCIFSYCLPFFHLRLLIIPFVS